MKMNVENKLDKVVKILKEKGFVVYRKGGKEPGVFYAKEGDSRIGFVYPNNGYIYDRIKMWSFSRIYKPHKKTGSSCLMSVSDEFTIENAIKNIEDRLWVNYVKDGNRKRPEEYNKGETYWYFIIGKPESIIDELINLEIGDTNVDYPYIRENRPWETDKMDWYDLREHADAMSDFIQKLYNYI